MHINVKVSSDYLAISVSEQDTIKWLTDTASSRYEQKNFQNTSSKNGSLAFPEQNNKDNLKSQVESRLGTVKCVRRQRDHAILFPNDLVGDVLNDGEYVVIEFENQSSCATADPEPHLDEEDLGFISSLEDSKYLEIDGKSLTPELLVALGRGQFRIKLSEESIKRVKDARKVVEDLIASNKVAYGINTGFGMFASTVIDKSKLRELQISLIRSHAAGVGNRIGLMATRMLFALRVNVLAKGYSGITLETLQRMIDIYNASCLPWVPEQGSVGASGDLAPLSHLALGLIGEGRMWSPVTGWTTAKEALVANGLVPLDLKPKEGLCLINGTQLITSIGAQACVRAEQIAGQADIIASLSLDVLKGTASAMSPDVDRVRPHEGQRKVAKRIRSMLTNELYHSELAESHRYCSRVQDAYTLRCCPQVHGIVYDTIEFVRKILTVEINSATDNPLVFPERHAIVSAGNFHGEYPAKALDYLAIGVHELANISERRIERLVNPVHSQLPAFLTKQGGLNSGFMIAHVTAAALVSENKVLCHPSSVDSISTSAAQEDHVSMGTFAARKCLQVVKNVETVLAIELLVASQALDLLRPLKSTEPLEMVHRLVRSVSPVWEKDRFMAPEIEAVTSLLRSGQVLATVEPYIDRYAKKITEDCELCLQAREGVRSECYNGSGMTYCVRHHPGTNSEPSEGSCFTRTDYQTCDKELKR
ncbi:Histidine ammonia-lyase [Clonorchis sinensis]|uniref:Histidine ammonia-lyase n=1 Tax=Clonorchis sinensis TaxID=79923 RepID=A0A419PGJ5_CLOSI|nr:Histidine ammonia-lyase [Clonorchis sinensis]